MIKAKVNNEQLVTQYEREKALRNTSRHACRDKRRRAQNAMPARWTRRMTLTATAMDVIYSCIVDHRVHAHTPIQQKEGKRIKEESPTFINSNMAKRKRPHGLLEK